VRVVVVGDSFSFIDREGPQLPTAPHLWPNVAVRELAEALGVEVLLDVLARPAQSARTAHDLVLRDRHAQFEVLAGAHAVVAAFGSYDHAPLGVPAPLRALVPYVRPTALRHGVRRALHRAHPVVVRATGGRWSRTPTSEFRRLYLGTLAQLRGLAFGAAGLALGPSSHRTTYYGRDHPTFEARAALQLRLAAQDGWAVLPVWPLVEPHTGELNVDGIHWPAVVHAGVGRAVGRALRAQLVGDVDRPPRPGLDV
jgi:hypothetical protein